MGRFIIRRVLTSIPLLFGVAILSFIFAQLLPGGPDALFGRGGRMTQAQLDQIRHNMGLDQPITVTPGQVAGAFLNANPQLGRDAINVSCDGRRLTEVRICLTKELNFRSCPEMARYSCRRDKVVMPAVRGR